MKIDRCALINERDILIGDWSCDCKDDIKNLDSQACLQKDPVQRQARTMD